MAEPTVPGPLVGIRVVEFAGVGPGPFCAMLLADMGADVITLDRAVPSNLGIPKEPRFNPITRSRRSIALDLKTEEGRATALAFIAKADALIEGHRPGVMERLGLSPEICHAINPALVYGRMTGWGQEGPLADSVGHDLNYLAMTGALALMGPPEKPAIPLNLIGDYGGGGVYLALGLLAAIIEARRSGKGQVVDAAMIDGILSLMTAQFGFLESRRWSPVRGSNFLDGGAPWYNVYETADGAHVSVAAIEPKFYCELVAGMGLEASDLPEQMDQAAWPSVRERFAAVFRSRTRDAWVQVMAEREACFAPVLSPAEAARHPHMVARGSHRPVAGVLQPVPAPRFSRTPSTVQGDPPRVGDHDADILADWGVALPAPSLATISGASA
ncbi:CoA transferase [Sphingomonas sp. CGMCC 1.13654]|uniref:CoA transferase n=1 Tax=Sphingomonas chungangi TaxID=2683589 RepID=A0A838L993_9SPHN|nr:CaiB/BaiF CoA-transferase family protein [Sphingomonas chungangi]MBA2935285.1 CoA transferase [Sphingomonas chungangi]MVW56792.1 CoA transferase [Sphingomonas chungangi]